MSGFFTELMDDVADIATDIHEAAANTAHRVVDLTIGEDRRPPRRPQARGPASPRSDRQQAEER